MTRVTRAEFSDYCDKQDCNRFNDKWNKSGSVVIRSWYNSSGLIGIIINWATYYINSRK